MNDDQITHEELSRLGRYLAGHRRIVDGKCEVCGKPFTGTSKRRYCSNRCAVRAHRTRKAQQSLARQVHED